MHPGNVKKIDEKRKKSGQSHRVLVSMYKLVMISSRLLRFTFCAKFVNLAQLAGWEIGGPNVNGPT